MKDILYVVLFVVCLYLVINTREPREFQKLRKMYHKYVKILPEEFYTLRHKSVLVCLLGTSELGYNINKGHEIAICYDKDVNSMFHVLLHELAHCTVKEYDHSDRFWQNTEKLTNIAISNGFYKPIRNFKQFCGSKIKD